MTIADAAENMLVEKFNCGSEYEALLAMEINEELPRQTDHFFERCSERIKVLCPKYLLLCNRAFWHGLISITDFIKWHDVAGIFCPCHFILRLHASSIPPAQSLTTGILYNPISSEYWRNLVKLLKEINSILPSCSLPWISQQHIDSGLLSFPPMLFEGVRQYEKQDKRAEKLLPLDPDALFGAFAVFSAWLEIDKFLEEPDDIDIIKMSEHPFFNSIRSIFLARFEQVAVDKVQDEMDRSGFTIVQQDFVWQWVRGDIDLVQTAKAKSSNKQVNLPDNIDASDL